MTLDFHIALALLTERGRHALAAANELFATAKPLQLLDRLRREFGAALGGAALEQVALRHKARRKFSRAAEMLFEPTALEQASSEPVAAYRADRCRGIGSILEIGCGIGGDTLGLTQVTKVTAAELDPVRLLFADHNLSIHGRRDRVHFLDTDPLLSALPACDAVFVDPDRRPEGKRVLSLAAARPSLDELRAWVGDRVPLIVKAAPGVAWEELAILDAEVEFVSLAGELKECVLWFGTLRTTKRRATLLPSRATFAADEPAPAVTGLDEPLEYLLMPDAAVVRAGLTTNLASSLALATLRKTPDVLTADRPPQTPFGRVLRIEEIAARKDRRLGDRLRKRGVGRIEVWRNADQGDAASLAREWKLAGGELRVVVPISSARRACWAIGIPLPESDFLPNLDAIAEQP